MELSANQLLLIRLFQLTPICCDQYRPPGLERPEFVDTVSVRVSPPRPSNV